MTTSHLFHLSTIEPQTKREGGVRVMATKSLFPMLEGMSFYKLVLLKNAIREPHWHANADELGYCLKGKILITLYATNNVKATFLVTSGEAFFVPSGSLHGIENVGEDTAEIILQFSHEEPEDFGLSSVFGMFSDAVLGNTWNVSQGKFKPLLRTTDEVFIAMRKGDVTLPKDAYYSTPYRYSLENASPLVSNEGGSARVARKDVWPIVERQALYSLELTGQGMREPHWHPNTAELGYIHKGKGRISIQSPAGQVDTFEIQEGDIYFIPKAYPHHIENLRDSPLHLLIFFDQPMPADIGFTGSVKAYSNEVLMAVLNSPEDLFPSLPTYYKDAFIVKKINPLDGR